MTSNIAALIAKLQAHDASLDPRNHPTPRGQDEALVRKQTLARIRSGLMNLPDDLARTLAPLAALEAKRQATIDKQAAIEQQIAAAPDWTAITDAREQDREYDRQTQLKRQLQLLRDGRLLSAPGVTYERVGDLDEQIAEQTQRRDRAQAALDSCVQQADALLGEAVSI
jgi:hypothetical protein